MLRAISSGERYPGDCWARFNSFPWEAGRALTFPSSVRFCIFFQRKLGGCKVICLFGKYPFKFPFWRDTSGSFPHYSNHAEAFCFPCDQNLGLVVGFYQVCLLTSPCPFITRSAFIFCHSETFFSFSFPFSVVFPTSCLQHPALPVRVLTEPQERTPLQSSLSRISCRTT